jgi:hypothetical protein
MTAKPLLDGKVHFIVDDTHPSTFEYDGETYTFNIPKDVHPGDIVVVKLQSKKGVYVRHISGQQIQSEMGASKRKRSRRS